MIGLVPALAVAVGQPVWSRVDEPAHYDVIAQYAAGVYPRDSVTTIRPETLEIMERTGVYSFVVDSAYQRPDVQAGFQPMPAGLSDAEHVLWIRRHVYQYSYEAFQPPLYYAAALPAWKIGDALGGAVGALYAVRVFDALLAALLAPLSLLIALRLWPQRPAAGWGAAVLAAAMPGVDMNLTSITNDGLVAVLGGLTVLAAISGRVTLRRGLLVGVLMGSALLTKTTAIALVPAVALALMQRRRAGGPAAAALALGVTAALVAPWVASNIAIYGEAITTKEQLAMAAFPARSPALDFWSVSTLHSFVTFWSGDPFLSLATSVPMTLVAALLGALALGGLVRAWSTGEVDRAALAVVAVAAAGGALVSVTSPVLAAFNAPGRLAYVGLPAAMGVVAVGLWREVPSVFVRRGMIATFAGLAAISLAVLVLPQTAPPAATALPASAQVRPLDAQGSFQGFSVDLRSCLVDTRRDVWLVVVIRNSGPGPAEWSQTAEIRSGGQTLATSDYARGSTFPMRFAPGQEMSGWLWLGPESRIAGASALTVRFRDVAADGYRSIGDISIPTDLC